MIKKRILLLFISCSFFSITFATWEPIGPYGGNLRALAMASSDSDVMYVATNENPSERPSLIFRSTDGGNVWIRVGEIFNYVHSLAVDPTDPGIVYAGSYKMVYKSTNSGASWVGYSVSDFFINGLIVHPTIPSTIYASGATFSGNYAYTAFFKSTDGGENWSTLTLSSNKGFAYCVAVDPLNPNTVYVGGYDFISISIPKIYKSTDGGLNFTDASSGLDSSSYWVYSLKVHPTNPNYIYAGTEYGIYRTTDGGGVWTKVSDYIHLYSLATTPADPNIVYAGADDSVYKSTDSGSTWYNTGSSITGSNSFGLEIHKIQDTEVMVANTHGFYKTTNGGIDWFASNYGINAGSISDLSVAPSTPSTIYTESGYCLIGFFKSTIGGSSWIQLPKSLACGKICDFVIDAADPNTVYAQEGAT